MIYFVIKWIHVVSATVLFGFGAGIAWFLWRTHRTGNPHLIAAMAREVVLADAVFTATAVIVQPVTGIILMRLAGYPFSLLWIRASVVLFVFAGCCWLPVVWLQAVLRKLACEAASQGQPLPLSYHRYFAWWLALGWPAFGSVLAILWLMTAKPA
jgi:uncharacterized membrane protein